MNRMQFVRWAAWSALVLNLPYVVTGQVLAPCDATRPCVMAIARGDLQAALDAAPPYSTLVADKRQELVVEKTIHVNKPVTITGLRARLREKLPKTPLIEIFSEGVTISDFVLTGNISTVAYEDRASLIVLRRGNFIVQNGEFLDSAKDGVMVTPLVGGGNIEHGVIRNIVGRNNARDLVSIAGLGEHGLFVRHVLVENVRCYDSRDRGAAEASDGSEFITFRDIYSESSVYGIDVQDHNREGQVNRNIVIDGLHVRHCISAVRTANHNFGHTGLLIRNLVGESFRGDRTWLPLHIRNTRNVQLENIRLQGSAKGPVVHFSDIWGLVVHDLSLGDLGNMPTAVHVENVDDALFDNVTLDNGEIHPDVGILFRISNGKHYRSLRVQNCLLETAGAWGLAIEKTGKTGSVDILELNSIIGKKRVDLEPRVDASSGGQF